MENKEKIKNKKNFAKKTFENMKEFTKDKAIPSIKKTAYTNCCNLHYILSNS